ncbi:MAG TPA: M48 family metalloprotease, partial [Bryobacteraceae bacterium]|nr:M48 family metalloprotease [Bryobacteraceae bacterium]
MFLVRIIEALAVASLFGMLAQDVPQQGDITLTVTVTANGDVTLNAFWFSADPIPGNIEKAVRDNFPCNWRDVHAGERYFAGTCKRLLKSDGTVVGDTLRLAGLTSALQAETGVKHLNVAVFIRGELGDTKDEPKVDSRWTVYRDDKRRSGASYSFRTDTGEPPPDLPVRAGHKFQPDRLIVPLVVVLSLPVLTAILLTKGRAGRPAGGRLVWLSWINLGTFIYWISAASLSDLAAFCSRIAPDQQWLVAIAGVLFFSLPLLIAVFLCLLVSHPPAEKGELAAALKRNMTAQALSFVPLSFIIVGAFMFARSRPVAGATMIGAFLSYRALAWAASHWTYSRIRLLSGGELRDRVSALAAKAGVRVPNLYLLRSLVPREVNAYAMSGGNVMLTESMLRALPRREVDAVMAHEIGHLRGRHIAAKTVVLWAAILLSGPLMGFMVTRLHLPEWIWHVPIFAIGITFLMARISQRNEFSADAQAAQLTGDPEAKIAALARLTKLTQSPVDWGGMQGSILSHPSMRARVLALGRRFNVPDERALAILENPDLIGGGSYELENLEAAISAAPASAARRTYALPAELASGDPLFNTGAKQRCLVSALWTIEILAVLLPLALSYGIRALPYGPKKDFLLFLAGLVFCFLIALGTEQWMWKNFYRRMKAALAQRLKCSDSAALFAGLCPGPETMRLEGFPDWDLGFLTLEGGRLIYLGERISFSLD